MYIQNLFLPHYFRPKTIKLSACDVILRWGLDRGEMVWWGELDRFLPHNLNLIGPGPTVWGQYEEKISHINQDKIIS
jgi:hypothetical protein